MEIKTLKSSYMGTHAHLIFSDKCGNALFTKIFKPYNENKLVVLYYVNVKHADFFMSTCNTIQVTWLHKISRMLA